MAKSVGGPGGSSCGNGLSWEGFLENRDLGAGVGCWVFGELHGEWSRDFTVAVGNSQCPRL